jgi:hypothetical protein
VFPVRYKIFSGFCSHLYNVLVYILLELTLGISFSIVSGGLLYHYLKIRRLSNVNTRQLKQRIDLLENRVIEHHETKIKQLEDTIQVNTRTLQRDTANLNIK